MARRGLVLRIPFGHLLLGVAVVTLMITPLWAPPSWARDTPAPVVEASGSTGSSANFSAGSGASLEARMARLERLLESQALVDITTRIDSLQSEVQRMLGQLEEQAHDLDGLKKRQRDLYLDIDQRLRQISENKAPAPAMGAFVPAPVPIAPASSGRATPATASTLSASSSGTTGYGAGSTQSGIIDVQEERLAYERAFNLLKDGRYDLAVTAFQAFVKSYPDGDYADNAQYWLGEANYVQRNFKEALAEFDRVVKNYPTSPKRADAMLKMGYTYQELGQYDQARLSLDNIVTNYPGSTAASLAQKRLQDLKRLQ